MIVHGGAWAIPDSIAVETMEGCREAVLAGRELLEKGGSALDAVEMSVRVMELNPVYDAGRGSVLTMKGDIEMDAMIMDGCGLRLGSVASVRSILHPVSLARKVMEETPHCLFVGEGADLLADRFGFEKLAHEDLLSRRQLEYWKDICGKGGFDIHQEFRSPETGRPSPLRTGGGRTGEDTPARVCSTPVKSLSSEPSADEPAGVSHLTGSGSPGHADTVGACAMDDTGNVAMASSTGGTSFKYPGRVGDSPLVGSGGYADNRYGAVAATGLGEYLMRFAISSRVVFGIEKGMTAGEAASSAVREMENEICGLGGVIVIGKDGDMGLAYNTPRMAYAMVDRDGKLSCGV